MVVKYLESECLKRSGKIEPTLDLMKSEQQTIYQEIIENVIVVKMYNNDKLLLLFVQNNNAQLITFCYNNIHIMLFSVR